MFEYLRLKIIEIKLISLVLRVFLLVTRRVAIPVKLKENKPVIVEKKKPKKMTPIRIRKEFPETWLWSSIKLK